MAGEKKKRGRPHIKYKPGMRLGRRGRTMLEVVDEICAQQYHRIFDKLFLPREDSHFTVREQELRERRVKRLRDILVGPAEDSDFEHRR